MPEARCKYAITLDLPQTANEFETALRQWLATDPCACEAEKFVSSWVDMRAVVGCADTRWPVRTKLALTDLVLFMFFMPRPALAPLALMDGPMTNEKMLGYAYQFGSRDLAAFARERGAHKHAEWLTTVALECFDDALEYSRILDHAVDVDLAKKLIVWALTILAPTETLLRITRGVRALEQHALDAMCERGDETLVAEWMRLHPHLKLSLDWCAFGGKLTLVQKCFDMQTGHYDLDGALHDAALYSSTHVVDLLLERGARPLDGLLGAIKRPNPIWSAECSRCRSATQGERARQVLHGNGLRRRAKVSRLASSKRPRPETARRSQFWSGLVPRTCNATRRSRARLMVHPS